MTIHRTFEIGAGHVSEWLGSAYAFGLAVASVLLWALCGPYFEYSNSWALWINSITTIITFWMVFILQNTQNRTAEAMQIKLDEIIRSSAASNEAMRLEEASQEDMRLLRDALVKPTVPRRKR